MERIRVLTLFEKLLEFGNVVFWNKHNLPELWQGQFLTSKVLIHPAKFVIPFCRDMLVHSTPIESNFFLLAPPISELRSIQMLDEKFGNESFYIKNRQKITTFTFGDNFKDGDGLKGDIHLGQSNPINFLDGIPPLLHDDCIVCGSCLSVCPVSISLEFKSLSQMQEIKIINMAEKIKIRHSDIENARIDFNFFKTNSIRCINCQQCINICPITRKTLCKRKEPKTSLC